MNKIKTALLSYGMSGKVFHAPFIQLHHGFELAGSWERTNKLIANDFPGVTSYPSIEAILEDDSIELVIVNTPTYTHFEYAMDALQTGKHVVVEKAFTTSTDEASILIDTANSNNLVLSVFQNRRWDSDFLTVSRIVNEGMLGNIVEATFCYDRYNPALSPKAHKETPGPGSGVVYDLGPHLIDQALVLFGMPDRLFADIMTTRSGSRVPDYFEILLYYTDFRVRLHSGYFIREPVPSFAVHGKEGSFLKTRADVQEGLLQQGISPDTEGYGVEPESEQGLLHTVVDGDIVRKRIVSERGNYLAYYDGIHGAIRNGQPVPVSAQDGLRTIQLIEAAYKSSQNGAIVDF